MNNWILVKDRLPETGAPVLIVNICEEIAVGWVDNGYFETWDDRFTTTVIVTHWMPLPELPENIDA